MTRTSRRLLLSVPRLIGTVFVVCGTAYIGLARSRLDWILLVSGPLLVVGTLFLLSWRLHEQLHTSNPH
jgi:hypothetical protein